MKGKLPQLGCPALHPTPPIPFLPSSCLYSISSQTQTPVSRQAKGCVLAFGEGILLPSSLSSGSKTWTDWWASIACIAYKWIYDCLTIFYELHLGL